MAKLRPKSGIKYVAIYIWTTQQPKKRQRFWHTNRINIIFKHHFSQNQYNIWLVDDNRAGSLSIPLPSKTSVIVCCVMMRWKMNEHFTSILCLNTTIYVRMHCSRFSMQMYYRMLYYKKSIDFMRVKCQNCILFFTLTNYVVLVRSTKKPIQGAAHV